jgi:hypothetical protein
LCRTRVLYAQTEDEAEVRKKEYEDVVALRDAWKALQDDADKTDEDLDSPKKSFAATTKEQAYHSNPCKLLTFPA